MVLRPAPHPLVWVSIRGVAGELLLLSVALLGLLLRLLAAPPQPVPEDRTDVLDMVGDAEVAADHLGDPSSTPQGVGPAVLGRPLEQEGPQLAQLLGGKPDFGARVWFGGQPLGCGLSHLLPAVK